jgi:tetratricopeptide (TPR) repeat protein
MDLSRLKWPLAIAIVVGVVWLGTSSGVGWMESKFSQGEPGKDATVDARNEIGLSRVAGFLLKTFRYDRAEQVLEKTIARYPSGSEYWYNTYRLAKAKEKLGKYDEAVQLLGTLIEADAHSIDDRVANSDILTARREKLIEVHELQPR